MEGLDLYEDYVCSKCYRNHELCNCNDEQKETEDIKFDILGLDVIGIANGIELEGVN